MYVTEMYVCCGWVRGKLYPSMLYPSVDGLIKGIELLLLFSTAVVLSVGCDFYTSGTHIYQWVNSLLMFFTYQGNIIYYYLCSEGTYTPSRNYFPSSHYYY